MNAILAGGVAMTADDQAARTFVFFPEGAFGPTNNCIGIGDVLRRRGHRVVFVIEASEVKRAVQNQNPQFGLSLIHI